VVSVTVTVTAGSVVRVPEGPTTVIVGGTMTVWTGTVLLTVVVPPFEVISVTGMVSVVVEVGAGMVVITSVVPPFDVVSVRVTVMAGTGMVWPPVVVIVVVSSVVGMEIG
jgi:hypothetical protein